MIKNYRIYILFFLILILVILYGIKNRETVANYFSLPDSKTAQETMEKDSYYQHFSKLDITLRKCGKNTQECQQHYLDSILDFSEKEKKMLEIINQDYLKLLDGKFSRIFNKLGPLHFMKVKNDIENGMPHTRGEYIVFSKSYFSHLLNLYQENPHFLLDKKNREVVRLIAHERFHIFQRIYPQIIENFYHLNWKLEKVPQKLPPEILEINRTNPDALPDKNWIFHIKNQNYILPLCVYQSKNSHNINQTKNIYVRAEKKNGKIVFPKLKLDLEEKNLLQDLKEFTDFFGYEGANNYHPHEISASLFEDVVCDAIDKKLHNENKTNSLHRNSEAYTLLVDFISQLN